MSKNLFITGTGTDIGKTYITALIVKKLHQSGVFSRPFLNCLYAMVPYIIAESELIHVLETMKAWFNR